MKQLFAILVAVSLLGGCRFREGGSSTNGPEDAGLEPDSPVGQGAMAVEARQCGQCHQSANPGDGVLSGQDTPVPGTHAYGSNLTPDPDTGMDLQDPATIATSVLQAVRPDGGPLCAAMPAYADAGMDAAEALAIGAYLRSLEAVRHAVPASTCHPR
jgi:mono/diheme cytochrome c family protein